MTDKESHFDSLMEILDNQKRNVSAAVFAAREELRDMLDTIEERFDDFDSNEIALKLKIAKLKALEELDELEEKLEGIADKVSQSFHKDKDDDDDDLKKPT
jgi:tetrahydromethanopterin S-methyltransferase subunit G